MTTHSPAGSPGTPQTGSTLDRTATEAKSETRSLAEDAKSAARDAADAARDKAKAKADEAKHGVAREVGDVASALRKAAEESRHGSPQERTFGQIAEGLADISETIADKDLGEMAGDLSDFARRNPLAFLGGAALLGFAATRFAKAGRPATEASPRDFYEAPRPAAPAVPPRPAAPVAASSQAQRNGGVS